MPARNRIIATILALCLVVPACTWAAGSDMSPDGQNLLAQGDPRSSEPVLGPDAHRQSSSSPGASAARPLVATPTTELLLVWLRVLTCWL